MSDMTPEKAQALLDGIAPTPWRITPTDDTMVQAQDRSEVADITGDYNDPDLWPIMEANARLIAAAPDLARAYIAQAARIADLERQLAEAREVKPRHAEMLAKEMRFIVAADRWKGRDLSAAPLEKWSHLRPETRQFWIDTAARILSALKGTP